MTAGTGPAGDRVRWPAMGLRDKVKRITAGTDDMHRERRLGVLQATNATPIAEAEARTRVRICGEVHNMRIVPRAGAATLEVTIGDGTGSAVAVFFGRKRIGGVVAGRRMIIEGLMVDERGRHLLYNPVITLLP